MKLTISILGSSDIKVEAIETDTIESILEDYNIKTPKNFRNVVCFNGKVINSFFSLKACGIKNNNKIVILRKKVKNFVSESAFLMSKEEREEMIEENTMNERYRLADLGFQGWECDKRFNSIMGEIYEADKAISEEEDAEEDFFTRSRTVVPKTKRICEKPLPSCFFFSEF